jgi:hypothetical protein
MLKFCYQNSKLKELARYKGLKLRQVVAFDLPAGYTCPAANLCKAYSNRRTGTLTAGVGAQFRCYAANVEAYSPAARRLRWYNYDLLRKLSAADMAGLIDSSLPADVKIVRIHSSGDFFSNDYFSAWVAVAKMHPEITFFGYTKILPYVQYLVNAGVDNFKFVYSFGGKFDYSVVDEPVAYVVDNPSHADKLDVPVACIDHPADDYDYIVGGESFAIVLHGGQPKGAHAL